MDKNKVQPLEGQSLLDIAVQTAGSVEAAIEMATVNAVSVSDDLSVNEPMRPVDVQSKSIVGYYDSRGIKPATAVTDKGQIFEDIFKDTFQ